MQLSQNSGHSFQTLFFRLQKGDMRVWLVRLDIFILLLQQNYKITLTPCSLLHAYNTGITIQHSWSLFSKSISGCGDTVLDTIKLRKKSIHACIRLNPIVATSRTHDIYISSCYWLASYPGSLGKRQLHPGNYCMRMRQNHRILSVQ